MFIQRICLAFMLMICYDLHYIEAKLESGESLIGDIKLSYENGIWQCGTQTCPLDSFGCKITRKNNAVVRTKLDHQSICLGNSNTVNNLNFDITNDKTIDIDIYSFEGAETAIANENTPTSQIVKGTVAPSDWPKIQQQALIDVKSDQTFLDNIDVTYKDGIWQCDHNTCPKETHSCRVAYKTIDDQPQTMKSEHECYDKNNALIATFSGITNGVTTQIFINLHFYVDDHTSVTQRFTPNGQISTGSVNLDEWDKVKNNARDIKNAVGNSIWKS